MKTILILESNPRRDLSLDQEIGELEGVIERSRNREEFAIKVGDAVRPENLHELMLKHEPQIVHFCGHGMGQQGLVFQDDAGQERLVSTEALSELFSLCAESVECVLLNACYSEVQAEAIVQHIDYAIGMRQEIRDDAARHFAQGFYRALGYGKPIEASFKWGCNAIQLMLPSGTATRSGTAAEKRKLIVAETETVQRVIIPEYLKPILKTRLHQVITEQPIAVQRETEAKLTVQELQDLSRALEQEDALTKYRNRVREFLDDRKLSAFEKIRLQRLRKDLQLSEVEAEQILAEEQTLTQKQIEQAQYQYEEMLIRLIEEGQYPFDAATREELAAFREELELTDEQVEAISQPILATAAEDHQKRQQQWQQAVEQKQQQQWKLLYQNSQEETQLKPLLKTFEFRTATINLSSGFLDTEAGINYRQGRAEYFTENLIMDNLSNGVSLDMVSIPGGTFTMGSPDSEFGHSSKESPQHKVKVQPFHMGKFAVTQAQWRLIASLPKINLDLDPEPSYFKGENRPVEGVSWYEAIEFCHRLSHKTGKYYQLPSEAEWEYACRAGTTTPFHFGETLSIDLANYDGSRTYRSGMEGNYRGQTTEVGSFPSNSFGLYDMHGNVWEWCADHWHDNYQDAPIDSSAWTTDGDSDYRLLRGGSWNDPPWICRSAYRLRCNPVRHNSLLGFRLVCNFA